MPYKGDPRVKQIETNTNGLLPVVLPSGKIHIGWPSRQETPERMVERFKKICDKDDYKHPRPFDISDINLGDD